MILKDRIIYLLILVFICVESTNEVCADGCLKCNHLIEQCEVCDVPQNFYDDRKGGCIKKDIQNCAEINFDGKCKYCNIGFQPIIVSGECTEVPKSSLVENCLYYDSESACSICELGFYLKEGTCRKVLVPIPFCQFYQPSNPSVCTKCENGKILNLNGTSCDDVPTNMNCSIYNYYDCVSCSDSLFYNRNSYIYNLLEDSTKIIGYMMDIKDSSYLTRLSKYCYPITVSNCRIIFYHDSCLYCNQGYFRTANGQCEKEPEEPLKNCIKYKGLNLCAKCTEGYYLESNQCKELVLIDNCVSYASDQNSCLECNISNYINSSSLCSSRVVTLNDTNCETLEIKKDKCLKCKSGFTQNDSGKCVSGFQDCIEYSSLEPPVCSQCDDGYYFDEDNQFCAQPLDFATNPCLIYGNSPNECKGCKPGFYLDNTDSCQPHDNLDSKCISSSGTVRNECFACQSGYGLFENSEICAPVTTPNSSCLEWRSATECSLCLEGFQAPNCVQIDPALNCAFMQEGSTTCSTCKSGYFSNPNTNNKCIAPNGFEKKNCEEFELAAGTTIPRCKICNKGTFFMEIENFYGCSERTNYTDSDFSSCDMIEYDENTENYTCRKCKDGKVFTEGICTDECEDGKIRSVTTYSVDSGNSSILGIETMNECIDKPANISNNCEYMVPVVDSEAPTYVCGKCASGFNKIFDLTTASPTFNFDTDNENFDSIVKREASFSCEVLDMIEEYKSDNCEHFAKDSSNKHGCIKCRWGFHGVIKKPVEENDEYFIKECIQMTDCVSSETNTIGITTPESFTKWKIPLETYLTCIKCKEKTQLPVVFLRKTNDNSPLSPIWFSLLNYVGNQTPNTSVTDTTSSGRINECYDINIGSLFGYAEDYKVQITSFCALILYRIDYDPNEDLNKENPTLICAACLPTYRIAERFDSATDIDAIKTCELIPNCNQSIWYNNCSRCQDNYNYKYDPDTNYIRYDYCIAQPPNETNCFASLENGACFACKKGYSLNDEGFCEDFNFSDCTSSLYLSRSPLFQRISTSPVFYDNSSVLYFHGLTNVGSIKYGCSKCTEDYIGVTGLNSLGHCVNSNYILQGNFNEIKFIKNCTKFGWDFSNLKHICQGCKPGFMPNYSGSKCVQKLDYCLRASVNGENFCNECQQGFTLINNICVQNNINNCLQYNVSNNQLICVECSNGYYLYNNKFCIQGIIQNCNVYKENEKAKCIQCKDYYSIFEDQNGNSICVPFDGQNCKSWNAESSGGAFKCQKCEPDYYISPILPNYKTQLCFGPLNIDKCNQIDVSIVLTNKLNFECKECENNYFKYDSNTSCLILDQVDYCKTFSEDSNRCQECEDNYYLDYLGKSCNPYPKGLFGCEIYRSNTECYRCQPNMYLMNNVCNNIDPSDWIENCSYYSSKEFCLECSEGFFLNKNICNEALALNCLTYKKSTACETCPEGYGLILSDDGITNCILISVPFCEKSTKIFPFECIICQKGYYPQNGSCYPADKIINCDYYYDKKKCLKCTEGYIRKIDGSECQDPNDVLFPMDPSCNSSFYSPTMVCTACQPGYFFSEGFCKPCNTGEKCMICDPFDSTKCLVCAPGTTMNSASKCDGTPLPNFVGVEIVEKDKESQSDSSEYHQIITCFVVSLLLILIV